MTTREKLIQAVLDLPESEVEPVAEILASRISTANASDLDGDWGEPEIAPLLEGWGRLPSGAPAPNWVAVLDEVRHVL